MSIRYLSGIDVDANTLFVDSANDRVGIGTASPAYKLDVSGTGRFSGQLNIVTNVDIAYGALTGNYIGQYYNGTDLLFYNGTGGSNLLSITRSTGNVGIGNTGNASRRLEVSQPSGYSAGIRIIADGAANATLQFLGTGASSQPEIGVTSASPDDLQFGVGGSERLRITSAGNVGIGTTAPGERLVVNAASGSNAIIYAATDTGQSGLKLLAGTGATNRATRVDFLNGVSSGTVPRWTLINDYNQNGTNDFRFVKDDQSTSVLTLLQDGNVGIGTTAPAAKIHGFNDNFSTSQGFLFEGFRSTYGATSPVVYIKGNWEYISGRATDPILKVAAYNDPNGFYILHNGNVGIGTTSPDARLTVYSDTTADGIVVDVLSRPRITLRDRGNSDTILGTGDYGLDDFFIDTYSGNAFAIDGATRNVGIGTTSPVAQLQVTSATNAVDVLRIGNTAGNLGSVQGVTHLAINHFNAGTNPSTRITAYQDGLSGWPGGMYFSTRSLNTDSAPVERVRITSGGYVGISTTSPQALLDVNGDVIVRGTLTELSTRRIKENITPLEPSLEKVNQLEPVSYNKIDTDNQEIGLIAEDVAELFPEVVTYDNEGRPQGIQYQRLSVILLKAVQELTERVNKLENK